MTTYSVQVDGTTHSKRSAKKAYPVAIVQRETGRAAFVSFAGSMELAEKELRARAGWQAKYPAGTYTMEVLLTTVA